MEMLKEENTTSPSAWAKVPEVTLVFWLAKIAATTLGETAGDAVSMSMNVGYLVGTLIFASIFALCVWAQIRAKTFQPALYWATIVATTTARLPEPPRAPSPGGSTAWAPEPRRSGARSANRPRNARNLADEPGDEHPARSG
mgnify:CR=1 FL=1